MGTQFEKPTSRGRDPLMAAAELAKRRKLESDEKKDEQKAAAVTVGKDEVRIYHILKKHRDFFGKPATSWRQKEITWSKREARAALEKLRDKLLNISVGGGKEALL